MIRIIAVTALLLFQTPSRTALSGESALQELQASAKYRYVSGGQDPMRAPAAYKLGVVEESAPQRPEPPEPPAQAEEPEAAPEEAGTEPPPASPNLHEIAGEFTELNIRVEAILGPAARRKALINGKIRSVGENVTEGTGKEELRIDSIEQAGVVFVFKEIFFQVPVQGQEEYQTVTNP